ncbi:MAG: NAD(+) synthase [Muribaculaceae bacterium]|nr:NAD(+) synthase [Muribaculaceae bacterium]
MGNVDANVAAIIDEAQKAAAKGVDVMVTPELSLTGYTCADLFHNQLLLQSVISGLEKLAHATECNSLLLIVGAPLRRGDSLFNCAVAIQAGQMVGVVPKTYIPNYNEFYEYRWFAPAPKNLPADATITIGSQQVPFGYNLIFNGGDAGIGIEICEDLWTPVPPSSMLTLAGANVMVNLSASNDLIGKRDYLLNLISQQSARCNAAYIYASSGWGESTTDLVFDPKAIIAENGRILAQSPRWQMATAAEVADIDIDALNRDRMHNRSFSQSAEHHNFEARFIKVTFAATAPVDDLLRHIDAHPFVPSSVSHLAERCEEIINIQALGLARRLDATRCCTLVVGISGGLDSTLALLVACKSFDLLKLDRKGIIGVTMPGFGTTGRTYNNALKLMEALGITIKEVPIAEAVKLHFRNIGHDPELIDVTYENSQARERTQILMDIANQLGGMVLGTGDLSELALGWATYNGDHMSMYGVNTGVPKTLVKHLVKYFADNGDEASRAILLDIVDTPISPELTPADSDGNIAQKTEDLVGPYELHDFFLYYMLRYGFSPERIKMLANKAFKGVYDEETIDKWLKTFMRRFFSQQFKRSCLPDGPKVGSATLSPRGDWRMPSDISSAPWLQNL